MPAFTIRAVLAAGALFGLLVGCTSVAGRLAPVVPVAVSADTAAALAQSAGTNGVVRWDRDRVEVAWRSEHNERDAAVLVDVLMDLTTWTGVDFVLDDGDAAAASGSANRPEVTIQFLSRDMWPGSHGVDVYGITESEWDGDGVMRRADVYIEASLDQAARNLTITHEMIHAAGIGHLTCAGAVMFGGRDGTPSWEPTALDAAVTTAWYELPSGSDGTEYVEVVPGGPVCEAPGFEAVTVSGATYWCARTAEPRECRAVDGMTMPDAGDVADLWNWQGAVYNYDPTRYEVYSYEGRRLLCDGGEGRRACMYTDGPGPIVRVDAYVEDGFLYESVGG